MPKSKVVRGLLDTSVVIDLEKIERAQLPAEFAISAITMAELAAGPHATNDPDERARRQERLQRAEALVDPIPFDTASFRAYGRIYAEFILQDVNLVVHDSLTYSLQRLLALMTLLCTHETLMTSKGSLTSSTW